MDSTELASSLELSQIFTDYCNDKENYPDKIRVKKMLSELSAQEKYRLLSTVRERFGDTLLNGIAERGQRV